MNHDVREGKHQVFFGDYACHARLVYDGCAVGFFVTQFLSAPTVKVLIVALIFQEAKPLLDSVDQNRNSS